MEARYVNAYKLMEFANNMKDKTIDANDIARFPWADVRENVHAHWIIEREQLPNGEIAVGQFCSNCDYPQYLTTKFCPNCGAVMDEGSENEEIN